MKDLTHQLLQQLKALEYAPEGGIEPAVVRVFAQAKATPSEKCDAFWRLDTSPGRYSYPYFDWHSKLRRTRNHPVHGPELFALFR
jgi:hypothetical protein